MKTNFTMSEPWVAALPIRYDISSLVYASERLAFRRVKDVLKCQSFFDFVITDGELFALTRFLENGYTLEFKYLNDGNAFNSLKLLAKKNGYKIIYDDEWNAPLLKTRDIDAHLKENVHGQVEKNYQKYIDNIDKYDYVLSNCQNTLALWDSVLNIDLNSWKAEAGSDMKSLDREDLQYIFYLLKEPQNSSLLVLYKDDVPLAYSLMFRPIEGGEWYQVKWGASTIGRKEYAGIFCLFHHLRILNNEDSILNIDFWGRRSQTYDYLKTNEIKRMHIRIRKE